MARKKTYADAASRHTLRLTAREGHTILVDAETSSRMARVRQKGTSPELIVRRIVSALGRRYRIENRDLSGTPDLANRRQRWVIFVHGCFWHRHPGCRLTTTPRRNADFWLAKFERNVARDSRAVEDLTQAGYAVLVVWECETRKPLELGDRICSWFKNRASPTARARPRGGHARRR